MNDMQQLWSQNYANGIYPYIFYAHILTRNIVTFKKEYVKKKKL